MKRLFLSLASSTLAALIAFSPLPAHAASGGKSKNTGNNTSTTTKRTGTKSSSQESARKKSSPSAEEKPTPTLRPVPMGEMPHTNARSEIVIDAITGRILHEKNADERRAPASTQKLLTALIVAEEGNLDRNVVIQQVDTLTEPVMLYLKPGQVYTRRQLLEVLLVKSFNDVARALARDNAGSIEEFASKMNLKARQLGMVSSHFVNPNGLTEPEQFSTARDMAKLARAAYANPVLRGMMATKELTFRYADGRTRSFKNTNQVLRAYPYCNGMKTGYTSAAGHCLISSGTNGSRDVIVVMLGNNRRVWQDSCSLLAWGLAR